MAFFPARILLATDGSKEAQLAGRAGIEVANKSGSELHALHVGSPGGASPPHPYPGVTVEGFSFPAETMEEIEKRARELLEKQLRRIEEAGGTVAKAHLKVGKPDEEIVNLGERIGAGLVIVGSRGHSGIERLVLGSVSEGVVRHAHCSVLVVRGEGHHT